MLNYQLMKHTNQLISYYTKEIILYNYTCILATSSINTTCQQQWRRQVSEFGRAFEGQHAFWGGKIEFHEISPPPRCQNF